MVLNCKMVLSGRVILWICMCDAEMLIHKETG